MIKEIVKAFGAAQIPLKVIVKALPPLFEHVDGKVRAEAQAIAVELYRWVGQAIRPALQSLRPAQMKALETEWAQVDSENARGRPIPSRFLRSHQEKALQASLDGDNSEEPDGGQMDAFDLTEPQEIVGKLPSNFFDMITSTKWQDRKESVDLLFNLANVPRIASGDYNGISSALKRIIAKDVNLFVVARAAECLGALTSGLRASFTTHANSTFVTLIVRLKEKKPSVSTAIETTLSAMIDLTNIQLPEFLEDLTTCSDDKVPKVRAAVYETITKFFKLPTKRRNAALAGKVQSLIKPTANLCMKGLEDSTPEVRDSAALTFVALLTLAGERPLQPYFSKLDAVKVKKIKDLAGADPSGGVSSNTGGSGGPSAYTVAAASTIDAASLASLASLAAGPTTSKPTSSNRHVSSTTQSSALSRPTSTTLSKQTSSTGSNGSVSASRRPVASKSVSAGGQNTAASTTALLDSPLISIEEAQQQIIHIIPGDTITLLEDKGNWKNRLEGVNAMIQLIQQFASDGSISRNSEILIRYLEQRPGFKDSNVGVLASLCDVVASIVKADPRLKRDAANLLVPLLLSKMSEIKVRPNASECMNVLSETFGLGFVFSLAMKLTLQQKSPKVQAESLKWMESSLLAFGIDRVDIKVTVDSCKKLILDSSNQTVRASAIAVLATLRRFVGAALRDFLLDLKPSVLSIIDREFENCGNLEAPQPTRSQKSEAGGLSKKPSSSHHGSMADLLPREDISKFITPELQAKMENADWKIREEGLQNVQAIIRGANRRIQPRLGPLIPALKARLPDQNRNIVRLSLQILAEIVQAVGPAIEKLLKMFINEVINCCGSNKKEIASEACNTLDAIATQVPFSAFFEFLTNPLSAEGSTSRKQLITWLNRYMSPDGEVSQQSSDPSNPTVLFNTDVRPLVKPTLLCLVDRSLDVRKAATVLLTELMARTSFDTVQKACRDVKTGSLSSITLILENIKPIALDRNRWIKSQQSISSSSSVSNSGSTTLVSTPSSSTNIDGPSSPSSSIGVGTKPGSSTAMGTLSIGSCTTTGLQAPILRSNAYIVKTAEKKSVRELYDRQTPWTFARPSANHSTQLFQWMASAFREDVLHLLFSPDSNDQLKGSEILFSCKDNLLEEMIDNLDLIFKWVSLVLYQELPGSPRLQERVLQLLCGLFDSLSTVHYCLLDFEANSLLPFIVKRFGMLQDNSYGFASKLFRQVPTVFPASKTLGFALEGVDNLRISTQLYNLREVRHLANQGFAEASPALVLLTLYRAKLFEPSSSSSNWTSTVSSASSSGTIRKVPQDPNERAMMIEVSETAYSILHDIYRRQGESIWNVFGNDGPRVMQLYKSRFGILPTSSSAAAAAATATGWSSLATIHPSSSSSSANIAASGSATSQSLSASDAKITEIEKHLQSLRDIKNSTTSCQWLVKRVKEDSIPASYADRLVEAATDFFQRVLGQLPKLGSDASHFCYASIALLMAVFKQKFCSTDLSIHHLKNLVEEILLAMQEQQVVALTEGDRILSNLNTLVISILNNCNRSDGFLVLLKLNTETLTSICSNKSDRRGIKFLEFVGRCIEKLTKTLKVIIKEIDVARILLEIQSLIDVKDLSKYVQSEPSVTKSYKIVCSTLREIINLKGPDIYSHLSLLRPPPGSIHQLIQKMVPPSLTSTASTISSLNSTDAIVASSNVAAVPASLYTKQPADEKSQLTRIFKQLSDSRNRSESDGPAFLELYNFLKSNPKVDSRSFLAQTTEEFQIFVKTGLRQIQQQHQQHQQQQEAIAKSEKVLSSQVVDHVPKKVPMTDDDNDDCTPIITPADTNYQQRLAKLADLQQKLGLQTSCSVPPPMSSASSSTSDPTATAKLEDLKRRLETVKARSPLSTLPERSVSNLIVQVSPSRSRPVSNEGGASLSDLRERLQRIQERNGP